MTTTRRDHTNRHVGGPGHSQRDYEAIIDRLITALSIQRGVSEAVIRLTYLPNT